MESSLWSILQFWLPWWLFIATPVPWLLCYTNFRIMMTIKVAYSRKSLWWKFYSSASYLEVTALCWPRHFRVACSLLVFGPLQISLFTPILAPCFPFDKYQMASAPGDHEKLPVSHEHLAELRRLGGASWNQKSRWAHLIYSGTCVWQALCQAQGNKNEQYRSLPTKQQGFTRIRGARLNK